MAVAACLEYGLPLIVQDVAGDVTAKFNGWKRDAEKRNDVDALEFFSSRSRCMIYRGDDADLSLEAVEKLVTNTREGSKHWQAIALFDELAVIRSKNPGFFESIAPLFGNAGILAFGTEHREFGIPPSARAVVRRYLLWKDGNENSVIFDAKIPREKLADARSDQLVIYDPTTGELSAWDRSKTSPPLELITPAQVSAPREEPWRTWKGT